MKDPRTRLKSCAPASTAPPCSGARPPHGSSTKGKFPALPQISPRRRDCFGSRANESDSRRFVGGQLGVEPLRRPAKFLVRADAAEPSREKRRRGGWLPLRGGPRRRVRRRLPRVPRALAARPPRGRRAGQGRRQA